MHVLRCFENDNVTHVDGSIDPIRDKETIDTELQIKDLEAIEKRLEKVRKATRTGDKQAVKEETVLVSLTNHIEQGKSARSFDGANSDWEFINPLQLLTVKPVLYVCNVDEASAKTGNAHVERVKEAVKDENAEVIFLAVATESDIAELEDYEEKQMFLEELGLKEPGVNRIIRTAYKLLKQQTYFTAGEKEVRAWTIDEGSTAPQAAGVIHTDFEKGFIRAEVIGYEDYVKYGSEAAARDAGKLRVEGKSYMVKDGDVMHFLFNV
jgi:GTP-binding protein YchF